MVGWCTAFEAPAQGNHHDAHTEEEEEEEKEEEGEGEGGGYHELEVFTNVMMDACTWKR